MIQPSWKRLVTVKVAAKPAGLWNLVVPYISGPRLLHLAVVGKHAKKAKVPKQWRLANDVECGPDGLLTVPRPHAEAATTEQSEADHPHKSARPHAKKAEAPPQPLDPGQNKKDEHLLLPTALRGALIGKVGGSTAELPDSSPAASSSTSSGRKVFVCGSHAIFELSGTDYGPLFLTMNDSPELFCEHSGELWVRIDESIL